MKKIKLTYWPIPFILIAIIGLWRYGIVGATQTQRLNTPTAVNVEIEWEGAPVQVTTDSTEKEGPIMRVSPDGESLLIAYNIIRAGTVDKFDTYYAKSIDQGASWITSTIHVEAGGSGVSSSQIDLEYDAGDTAHAVWVFGNSIVHSTESEWASNSPTTLYNPGTPVFFPNIATSDSETLDVIWSAAFASEIQHVRSTDGGDSWGLTDTVSGISSFKSSPDITEYNGNLHVVWEDVNSSLITGTIKYSQADPTVSPIVWSPPIEISSNTLTDTHDAHEASITVNDNVLQVSYTHRISKTSQWIYISTCDLALDCTQLANWEINLSPISGAVLGVNAEAPWNMFSDLISYNGCTYAHFHGTTADYAEDNELIWSVNSCNNWTPRRELTNPQVQALFPSATVRGQRVYMAYGQNPTLSDPVHQIFFTRSTATGPTIYLPVILR